MDLGVGFSEIIVILILVLVLFGSKELPRFVREGARLTAKVRQYSDKIRRELDSAVSVVNDTIQSIPQSINSAATLSPTELLREKYLDIRNGLDPQVRTEKSASIHRHLLDSEQVKKADAIMIYVAIGSEVETREAIRQLLVMGKRVVIPYCRKEMNNLGLIEITDIEKDIIINEENMPVPNPELRKQFYRSDLNLVVCPGVVFDRYGSRIGRSNDCYDNFLREIQGNIPVFGLAFDSQIQDEHLPFSNFNIVVNEIITENGFKSAPAHSASVTSVPLPISENPIA